MAASHHNDELYDQPEVSKKMFCMIVFEAKYFFIP